MIGSQSQPKAFPPGILKTETLVMVNKARHINSLGFSILNRWMLSDPDLLRKLEQKNEMLIIMSVLNQQTKEQRILDSPNGQKMKAQGQTDYEILSQNGVDTTLQSAIAETGVIM